MIENDAAIDPVRRAAAFERVQEEHRLHEEARVKVEQAHRLRELQDAAAVEVAWATDLARDALGKHAGPEAVAILASAVLGRRYLS